MQTAVVIFGFKACRFGLTFLAAQIVSQIAARHAAVAVGQGKRIARLQLLALLVVVNPIGIQGLRAPLHHHIAFGVHTGLRLAVEAVGIHPRGTGRQSTFAAALGRRHHLLRRIGRMANRRTAQRQRRRRHQAA